MRLTFAASDLHDALKQSAFARTTPLDAYRHVLIEPVDDHTAAVEAFDGTTRTRITVPTQAAEGSLGGLAHPGAAFLEGDKLLAISAGGGTLTVADSGQATRGRSRYQVSAMPVDDFPRADDASFIDSGLDPVALAAGLAQVEHAADDKDVRPYCRATFIANGRLSAGNGAVISSVAMSGDAPEVLIPVSQLRHLQGLLHKESRVLLGNVREAAAPPGGAAARRAGLLRVEAGNTTVTIACIEHAPFDVRKLVDSLRLPPAHVVFKRKPLIDALRRFVPFVVTYGKGDSGVVLQLARGEVRIADRAVDASNSEDITEHVTLHEGGEFTVGLAHRYLLGVLGAMDADEVEFYPDASKPNLLVPRGSTLQQVAHLLSPQALKA
jgi:DNA polymerase III sliding clamp (beta) subunit (PCNA family)